MLGSLIISVTALPFTVGVFLLARGLGPDTAVTARGATLMIAAGVAAASTTVLALLAYAQGFRLSSSPVVTASQMGVVLLVGVVALDEPLGPLRLLALVLIALGVLLLQRAGG